MFAKFLLDRFFVFVIELSLLPSVFLTLDFVVFALCQLLSFRNSFLDKMKAMEYQSWYSSVFKITDCHLSGRGVGPLWGRLFATIKISKQNPVKLLSPPACRSRAIHPTSVGVCFLHLPNEVRNTQTR